MFCKFILKIYKLGINIKKVCLLCTRGYTVYNYNKYTVDVTAWHIVTFMRDLYRDTDQKQNCIRICPVALLLLWVSNPICSYFWLHPRKYKLLEEIGRVWCTQFIFECSCDSVHLHLIARTQAANYVVQVL